MRLTFLISYMGSGGAERVMAAYCNQFSKLGHEVTLITLDDGSVPSFYPLDKAVERRFLCSQKTSQGFWSGFKSNLNRIIKVRRSVRSTRPDLVISFLVSMNVVTLFSMIGAGVPVVVSERDDPWHPTDSYFWRFLRLITYSWADKIIVHTENAKQYFPFLYRGKVTPIPNPIMTPPQMNGKIDYEPTWNLVSVGRLVPQKGFDVLIRAFSNVVKKFPACVLQILGEGPEESRLKDLARSLGLEGRVKILGVKKNIFEHLERADIFVLASRFEGFGNVILEAMAVGLPVISTDASGPRSIIINEDTGLLVPIEDELALAETIKNLLSDKQTRQRLGQAGRRHVLEHYDFEKIARRWATLFMEVK